MKKVIILIVFMVLIFSSCDIFNGIFPGSGSSVENTEQDTSGNLLISNYSNERLLLYNGSEYIKTISNSSSDFLVNISNPDSVVMDLRLYKHTDVTALDAPDLGVVFKRWSVVLANDTQTEHRVTWMVQANTSEIECGELTLAYIGGTDNSVDVFLGSRTGAKLISLSPGAQNLKVGIEYGNYTVYYHYWVSNQNTTGGIEEVGWIDEETVNGNDVPIYVIINANRESRHLQIPHWNADSPIGESLYGNITITNTLSTPVQIYSGTELIENLMYTDEPITNASTIAAGDHAVFTLPLQNYTLRAVDLISGVEMATHSVEITSEGSNTWNIETE